MENAPEFEIAPTFEIVPLLDIPFNVAAPATPRFCKLDVDVKSAVFKKYAVPACNVFVLISPEL